MGLSAPRFKQRICVDPQNKSWADDTSKFGFTMLRKMGWDAGKGLGRDGSGMTEHVKVSVKNNSAGVGAKSTAGDNWLQNTDAFAKLLAELNERMEEESVGGSDGEKVDKAEEEGDSKKSKKAKKEKKSKKVSKKLKDKEQSSISSSSSDSESPATTTATPAADPTTSKLAHARYAARAKYLRNKKLATSSSEALTEILALDKAQRVVKDAASAPTSSSGSPSPTPMGEDADPEDAYRPAFGGLGASPFAATASSGASSAVDPLMAMFVTGRSHGGSMPAAAEEPVRDVKVLPSVPVAESPDVPKRDDETEAVSESGPDGKKAKTDKKSSKKKRSRGEDAQSEEASDRKRAKKEAKKAAKAAKKQRS